MSHTRKGTLRLAIGRYPVLLVVTIAVALSALALLGSPSEATITGDAPPPSGDWNIRNPTVIENETINFAGNIWIDANTTILNSTILLSPASEGGLSFGHNSDALSVNNSRIASGNGNRYRFRLGSETFMNWTTVEDLFEGFYVMSSGPDPITILNTTIRNFVDHGLTLNTVGRTVLCDVHLQSDAFDQSESKSIIVNSADGDFIQPYRSRAAVKVLGNLDDMRDVDISLNGTYTYVMNVHKQVTGATFGLEWEMPFVHVASDGVSTNISGLVVRDSDIDQVLMYNVTNGASGGTTNVRTTYWTTLVLLDDFVDASVSRCSAEDWIKKEMNISINLVSGSPITVEKFPRGEGMILVRAFFDDNYPGAGPYKHHLTVMDIDCEFVRVLDCLVSPVRRGAIPEMDVQVDVSNVSADRGHDIIRVEIWPNFDSLKDINSTVRISNCTFSRLMGEAISIIHHPGASGSSAVRNLALNDTIIIENCTFLYNQNKDTPLIFIPQVESAEPLNVYQRWAILRNNTFSENSGCLVHIGGHVSRTAGEERVVIAGNDFSDNMADHRTSLMNLSHRANVSIANNTFSGNICAFGISITDYGGDATGWAPAFIRIADNTFSGNRGAGSNESVGAFFELHWGGALEVDRNNITGQHFKFLLVSEEPQFVKECTLSFSGNEVSACNGTIVYFDYAGSFHDKLVVEILDNVVWDNVGLLVGYNRSPPAIIRDDYDARVTFANNSVGYHDGTVFNYYGNLSVWGNQFNDCHGGFVIDIEHVKVHKPFLWGNHLANCEDGISIEAKQGAGPGVVIDLYDVELECSGTALSFSLMEVTLERVNVTGGAVRSVVADRAYVDAFDSLIPPRTGEVRKWGHIMVWFNVEVFAEWANAAGVPSGNPVMFGAVSFFNDSGGLVMSNTTDTWGHINITPLLQWSLGPVVYWESLDYSVSASLGSAMSTLDFTLDHPYVGEDAIELVLVDPYMPVLGIGWPEDGAEFNQTSLLVSGFADDVGSGVFRIELSVNGDPPIEVTQDNGIGFNHTLVGLTEGDVVITVRVFDAGLNMNTTSVTIIIDVTPPWIVIDEPLDGTFTNETTVWIRGTYEPCDHLVINMNEYLATSGVLEVLFAIYEGENVITITAFDRVGNSETVVIHVTKDTHPPDLRLLDPKDELMSNSTSVELVGDVREHDTISVTVRRTHTDIVNEPIEPDEEGDFVHALTLEQGENVIIVTARDRTGNVATEVRRVFVDSIPPTVEITSPVDGLVTNSRELLVKGTAESDAIVYLNDKRLANTGTFERNIYLDEGLNVVELRAVDSFNNEAAHTITVTLDTVPPRVFVTVPETAHVFSNSPIIRIAGTVEGEHTLVTVHNMPVEVVDGAFDVTIQLWGDGLHDIVVLARDLAGNNDTFHVTLDLFRSPPPMLLVFDPPGPKIEDENAVLTVHGTTTDVASRLVIVHGSKSGENTTTIHLDGNATFTLLLHLIEGDNTITVTVVDVYGNSNISVPHEVDYSMPRDDSGPYLTTTSLLLIPMVIVIIVLSAWILNMRRKRQGAR